jgi:hypothetical protein
MEQLRLNKKLFYSDPYKKIVNTSFTQLVSPSSPPSPSEEFFPSQILEFFQKYQELFYLIPKFGETNSHEYIIKSSSEYVGTTNSQNEEIQALINEITSLRQTNLELNQQLVNIQIK